MEITKTELIEHLGSMTVMEMTQLTRDLEETWGVSATPQHAETTGGPNPELPPEMQTEFDVVLESYGEKKIPVIKAMRELIPGLGLKEAKELVEGAPKIVKEGVSREEVDEIKEVLERAGGKVTIQ